MVLHRGGGAVRYPARFQLVLAANPCPCGSRGPDCSCPPQARRRYQQRLSGPLLDRIDVRVAVDPVPQADFFGDATTRETTRAAAARVAVARSAAEERWCGTPWRLNAQVPGSALRTSRWGLARPVLSSAESYLQRGQLSARGFDRVLRLSWTIADLGGHLVPDVNDVAEALYFRTGQRESWAA